MEYVPLPKTFIIALTSVQIIGEIPAASLVCYVLLFKVGFQKKRNAHYKMQTPTALTREPFLFFTLKLGCLGGYCIVESSSYQDPNRIKNFKFS